MHGLRAHARAALAGAAVLAGGVLASASAATSHPDVAVFEPAPAPPVGSLSENLPVSKMGRPEPAAVGPHGTPLFRISPSSGHDLPVAARRAYVHAAKAVERTRPGCDLYWELLAGIGRVESDHGRYGGSRLGTDGVSRPAIRGIALDGHGPVAAIRDSDAGRLDGDRVWDRAVGPLQFIPSTWKGSGVDGDGDGVANPDDLDDAALAAAGYLCPPGGSLATVEAMRAAVLSYNHSDYYVDLVMAFAVGYHTGVFDIPPPPVEEPAPVPVDEPAPSEPASPSAPEDPADPPSSQATPDAPRNPGHHGSQPHPQQPHPSPTPAPTQPPTPAPDPEPPASPFTPSSGAWTACGGGWCVGRTSLDLGPAGILDGQAASDLDDDGTVETRRAELDGLVGKSVSVQVARGTNVVYTINGAGYRNADGSFA